jgi:hypothetical protein
MLCEALEVVTDEGIVFAAVPWRPFARRPPNPDPAPSSETSDSGQQCRLDGCWKLVGSVKLLLAEDGLAVWSPAEDRYFTSSLVALRALVRIGHKQDPPIAHAAQRAALLELARAGAIAPSLRGHSAGVPRRNPLDSRGAR